jgi:hypothetical protein
MLSEKVLNAFEKRADLFFSEKDFFLSVFETGFYKYFSSHPGESLLEKVDGEFVHLDKAKSLLVKDFEDYYFSVLDVFSDSLGVSFDRSDFCFSRDFSKFLDFFNVWDYCYNSKKDFPVVSVQSSGSPVFNIGALTSLERDLLFVSHLAVDDFRLYLKNKSSESFSVQKKKSSFLKYFSFLSLNVILTASAVLSSLFVFYKLEKDSLERAVDEKIIEVKKDFNNFGSDFFVYLDKFDEYESKIKYFLDSFEEYGDKGSLSPELKNLLDFSVKYFEDNFKENLEENIYSSIKENLPFLIRDYLHEEYENFKKNPELRDNFYSELESFLDELVGKLSR